MNLWLVVSDKRCIFVPIERDIERQAKQNVAVSTVANLLPQNWGFLPIE